MARQRRIKEISREIAALSKELEGLLLQQDTQEVPQATIQELAIGDRIEITNNHRGLKGTKGVIVKVTDAQYQIKLDHNGSYIYRTKTNVRRTI
jgi:preprotein translocase subunit YajC